MSGEMTSYCLHPLTKEPLVADGQGNLCRAQDHGAVFLHPVQGCYNFAALHESTEDRRFYEAHYHGSGAAEGNLAPASIRTMWEQNSAYHLLYETVGDVRGKSILLLGNGTSAKELRFAAEGAEVVYTDLSLEAVVSMKKAYENSPLRTPNAGRIQFHAVDALHLPFRDETFDVIYGCAFVHHIQDLSAFFKEVHRCLKTGGKCIFLDDAYSPAWQLAKATILRPLQAVSQWRRGISPEDKLATRKGGYRVQELQDLQNECGFRQLMYRRAMFLEHLIRRGSTKLLNGGFARAFTPIGRFIDSRCLGPRWIDRHGLHLIWGYRK